jgi:hypothetical protein
MEQPTANSIPATPAIDAATVAPDWSTIGRELHCPLCEYNLRGLTEPRCPECGYRFEWAELLRAAEAPPGLFEFSSRKPVRSILRTAVATLRPRKFWKELKPTHPPHAGRLVVYWGIVSLIGVAAQFVGVMVLLFSDWFAMKARIRVRLSPAIFSSLLWTEARALLLLVAAELGWSGITFMSLMIFQASMRKAGIRKGHVGRCVLYSSDVFFWAGVATLLIGFVTAMLDFASNNANDIGIWLGGPLMLLLTLAVMIYRLCVACRIYLRFHLAVVTVLASQFVTGLFFFTVLMWISVTRW